MYTKWYVMDNKERSKKLQKELMEMVMRVNNNTKEEIMAMSPVYGCVDESKDRAYKGTPKRVTEERERNDYLEGYNKGVKYGIEENKEDELYYKFILNYGKTLEYLKKITKFEYPNYFSRDFHIIYGQMLQIKKLVEHHEGQIIERKIRRREKRKEQQR